MPAELLLKVHDLLHPVSSTCFGLTCKAFYTLHRKTHGKIKLNTQLIDEAGVEFSKNGSMLVNYLKSWVPQGWNYNYNERKFVTEERFEEFLEEIEEEETRQMYADYECTYEGLEPDEYDELMDRWLAKVDKAGWEYEGRPAMIRPTKAQMRRSRKWVKENLGY
jgi:hypothetical protein